MGALFEILRFRPHRLKAIVAALAVSNSPTKSKLGGVGPSISAFTVYGPQFE